MQVPGWALDFLHAGWRSDPPCGMYYLYLAGARVRAVKERVVGSGLHTVRGADLEGPLSMDDWDDPRDLHSLRIAPTCCAIVCAVTRSQRSTFCPVVLVFE